MHSATLENTEFLCYSTEQHKNTICSGVLRNNLLQVSGEQFHDAHLWVLILAPILILDQVEQGSTS